jgi:hypothetical protein
LKILHLFLGRIHPPTVGESYTLPITELTLSAFGGSEELSSTSLPLVRSLNLTALAGFPLPLDLIPQITSMCLHKFSTEAVMPQILRLSTTLSSLTIFEDYLPNLDPSSLAEIKGRIKILKVIVCDYNTEHFRLIDVVSGSRVMEKAILDGFNMRIENQEGVKMKNLLRLLKATCKYTKVELWKENFVINGKVNLG